MRSVPGEGERPTDVPEPQTIQWGSVDGATDPWGWADSPRRRRAAQENGEGMDVRGALRGAGYSLVNGQWVKPWAFTILLFDPSTSCWHQCFYAATGEPRVYDSKKWEGGDLSRWLADLERYTARQDLPGADPPHFSGRLFIWENDG